MLYISDSQLELRAPQGVLVQVAGRTWKDYGETQLI